jgi:hypothetical protein
VLIVPATIAIVETMKRVNDPDWRDFPWQGVDVFVQDNGPSGDRVWAATVISQLPSNCHDYGNVNFEPGMVPLNRDVTIG